MSIANTTSGPVEGFEQDGLHIFKGVPFAASPVGAKRWAPPEPPANWSEPRPAAAFGAQALQSDTPMSAMFGGVRQEVAFDEDCLTLNVWTQGCDDNARPVMVWIHGGAFVLGSGSSPMYDGATFAQRGVVLVSINYRLGALGFLRLKDVTNGAIPSCGNEGLLDQVRALEWVRDNIAGFGGDPNNVTIFGESAGGISVGCLMGMPSATPLFHKAIPQSGACHTASSVETANLVAEMTLEKLGIAPSDTEALINLDAAKVLAAQEAVLAEQAEPGTQRVQGMAYQPVIEDQHLSQLPIDAVRAGSVRGKPILVGNTLEEMKLFSTMAPGPTDLAQLRDRLGESFGEAERERLIDGYQQSLERRGVPAEAGDLSAAIGTDRMFRMPGVRLAEAQLEHTDDVFVYLFDWATGFFNLGACHALELAFVFGTHHTKGLEAFFDGAKPGADELCDAMMSAWCNFAATGNPGGEAPVATYAQNRATLIFGANCSVEEDPYAAERHLWDQLDDQIGQM
jgi:para-nitrobenzyl esterase